jgi:hypothetical protein
MKSDGLEKTLDTRSYSQVPGEGNRTPMAIDVNLRGQFLRLEGLPPPTSGKHDLQGRLPGVDNGPLQEWSGPVRVRATTSAMGREAAGAGLPPSLATARASGHKGRKSCRLSNGRGELGGLSGVNGQR